jgi:hypothetical protein
MNRSYLRKRATLVAGSSRSEHRSVSLWTIGDAMDLIRLHRHRQRQAADARIGRTQQEARHTSKLIVIMYDNLRGADEVMAAMGHLQQKHLLDLDGGAIVQRAGGAR